MQLIHHAGHCCGIKTLYGFGRFPDGLTPYIPSIGEIDGSQMRKDVTGLDTNSKDRFFVSEAPTESFTARLERYIAFTKRHRPMHLLEANLISKSPWENTQEVWFPILEAFGFKRVSKWKNSNSGNEVTSFHLVIDETSS